MNPEFDWTKHAAAALVDLQIALATKSKTAAMQHLNDARQNLALAIDTLEELHP